MIKRFFEKLRILKIKTSSKCAEFCKLTRTFSSTKIGRAVCIIAGTIVALHLFFRCIPYPALSEFRSRNWSVRFYDKNNMLVQVTPVQEGLRREFTSINKIPSDVKKIFISAEDSYFYLHHGINYFAITRAFIQNTSDKKIVSGASTITMQLARIVEPSKNRDWKAKLKDMFNAYRLEARLSKKQILELYLNSVPFGSGVEGITSAARTFFGCELTELTKEQICCLAVIPRRPSMYNPIENPQNCATASDALYKKTFGNKTLKNQDIPITKEAAQGARYFNYPFLMPHYIQYLSKLYGNSKTEIHLAADMDIQQFAEFQVKQKLAKADRARINNAAVLVIENKTGNVLAWVGSNNWNDTTYGGQIDGVLVQNQPGSSMKPFLYAFALDFKNEKNENAFYPNTILPDIPMEFGSDSLYIPLNFNNGFNGPVRLRTALASSLNIPAVYILSRVGRENYLNCLYSLNFNSLKKNDLGANTGLGLALGAGEVTLAELTTAFSVFTRDGVYIPMKYELGDAEKKSLQKKQVFSVDTSRLIADILSDKASRVTGFGYKQSFETSYPAIFKTGTANQFQNITALGATPDYTVGVWMGNFSGNTVMGKTGSSLPASIARSILDYLTNPDSGEAFKNFPKPEHWIKARICPLSGMAVGKNCPNSIMEYIPKEHESNFKSEQCTWHKNNTILYPAEYQQWLRIKDKNGDVDYTSAPLEIISPSANSTFFYNPSKVELQKIPVEIIGGTENSIEVFYDEKPFYDEKIISRPFVFSLPVEIGIHSLQIKCGQEEKMIYFEVK